MYVCGLGDKTTIYLYVDLDMMLYVFFIPVRERKYIINRKHILLLLCHIPHLFKILYGF